MSKFTTAITDKQRKFIAKQQMFFVATTGNDTRINLSPKGLDSLQIIDDNRLIWLNFNGSGNETDAHMLEDNRMTIMLCSFDETPLILRLYGRAKTIYPENNQKIMDLFPKMTGIRQLFDMRVELTQESCGTGVPVYQFVEQRPEIINWHNKKGEAKLKAYQEKNNTVSIDNKPTGLKF